MRVRSVRRFVMRKKKNAWNVWHLSTALNPLWCISKITMLPTHISTGEPGTIVDTGSIKNRTIKNRRIYLQQGHIHPDIPSERLSVEPPMRFTGDRYQILMSLQIKGRPLFKILRRMGHEYPVRKDALTVCSD